MGNQWNDRFSSEEYVYGEEPNAFIRDHVSYLKGFNRVVAFAEGEGRNAVFLARHGHEVTAWDYADNGLKKTAALAEQFDVKVSVERKDLIQDPVPAEEFDAAIMVFGHFPKNEQLTVFNKLISTVKSGGMIMLEVYSEDQLYYQTGGPKNIDLLYNPIHLLEWVKGHRVMRFFYGEANREEGNLHTGVGHIVQMIFKKESNA